MILPLVVRYEIDRDITRLTAFSLTAMILLAVAALSIWLKTRASWLVRLAAGIWVVALVLPGVMLVTPLASSLGRPMLAEDIDAVDHAMAARYWDALAPGALVLDSHPWRSVAVLGQAHTLHNNGLRSSPGVGTPGESG